MIVSVSVYFNADINGPVNTEDEDEESVSTGEAEDKQQKDEAEVKEEDAQHKQEASNTAESTVRRSKMSSACKFASYLLRFLHSQRCQPCQLYISLFTVTSLL